MEQLVTSLLWFHKTSHRQLNDHIFSIIGVPKLWISGARQLDTENGVGQIPLPKHLLGKLERIA
jgi:hypothetical protein